MKLKSVDGRIKDGFQIVASGYPARIWDQVNDRVSVEIDILIWYQIVLNVDWMLRNEAG